MHFFGSYIAKGETDAMIIFDIGSGHISSAIALYREGKKPHIVYSTTEPIDSNRENEEQLKKAMISSLLVVAMRVRSEGLPELLAKYTTHTKKIVCVFSSPWYTAYTKTLTKNYPRSEMISKQAIVTLLNEERLVLKEDIAKNGKLIECSATGVRLNGYKTKLEEKLEALSVEVDSYYSFISEDTFSKVEAVLGRMFNLEHIDLATYPLVATATIGAVHTHPGIDLYVDVTAEATDLVLHESESILHVSSVPFGKNTFLECIKKELETNEYDAMSRFTLFATKKFSKGKEADIVTHCVERVTKVWGESIASKINEVESLLPHFSHIHLTADDALASFFSERLSSALSERKGEPYMRHTPTEIILGRDVSAMLSAESNVLLDGTLGLCVLFYANSDMR